MDNKKQYYTNLSSNEKTIESRDGSKILMDSNGNVLLTTARRPEYIDPLRQEYYQGNIDLNPDEEESYFFIGTDQIIIDQQGNINQDTILESEQSKPDQQEELINEEPEFGRYSTYIDDNGTELGISIDLRYEEPVDVLTPPPPEKNWVTTNWTANTRATLLRNWPKSRTNIIAPPFYKPLTDVQKEKLKTLAKNEIDIWNPFRLTQPTTRYSRDAEGKSLPSRLGYIRPYYTEIMSIYSKKFPTDNNYKEYLKKYTPPRGISVPIYGEIISEEHYDKLYDALLKYTSTDNKFTVKTFTAVDPKNPNPDLIDSNSTPWSAYFISWLVSSVDPSFPKGAPAQSHLRYSKDVKSPNWELFPLPYYDDKLNKTSDGRSVKIKLEIGDILIAPRTGGSGSSHGDVVYDIDLKSKKALLVGGNLDDTVMITPVNIDENGFYSPEQPYRTPDEKPTSSTSTYVTYLVVLKRVK